MSSDPEHNQVAPGVSEEEPLLGRQGDAQLQAGKPLYRNLILGMLAIFVSFWLCFLQKQGSE